MKKLIAALLALAFAITASGSAIASGIDWESMTDQQITMAIAEAEAVLDARAENNVAAESADAPAQPNEYVANNMTFTIPGYYSFAEYDDQYVLVRIDWTNTSSKPMDLFDGDWYLSLYQDGMELDDGFVVGVDLGSSSNVLPGYSRTSYRAFVLNSDSDIQVFAYTYNSSYEQVELINDTIKVSDLQTYQQ